MIQYPPFTAMDTKQLKKLTEKFSAGQIQACNRQQLDKGENSCDVVDETDEVIAALSKAEVVRMVELSRFLRNGGR